MNVDFLPDGRGVIDGINYELFPESITNEKVTFSYIQ